jgi:hypothetical protein
MNSAGCTFSDQKQLTVKLKFHFQSGNSHSMDDLNARCATKLQNDSVSLLSCILNTKDTSPEQSATLHAIPVHHSQVKQLSDLTGAKVTRDEWCHYSVKIDKSMMHKYEKKKTKKTLTNISRHISAGHLITSRRSWVATFCSVAGEWPM